MNKTLQGKFDNVWTKFGTSDPVELVARIPEIIHDSNIKVEVARKGQLSFRH